MFFCMLEAELQFSKVDFVKSSPFFVGGDGGQAAPA